MHLNELRFTRLQLASTKFSLEVISSYTNSRFILTMFPVDLNAKFDITLIRISRRFQI